MARDPLATLIKVRHLACDAAQRALVDALAAEGRAEQVAHAVERTIAEETEAAADPEGSDSVVEAFAAWLPGARRQLDQARRSLISLQSETTRARAELTACRTALESVEALQQQRRTEARRARERALERELEDRPRRRATDTA